MGKRLTYEFVKNFIEDREHTLVSNEYINSTIKLDVMCPEGHIYPIAFSNFKAGWRCPKCSGKHKHTYDEVKEYMSQFGYTPISKTYENTKTILDIMCPEGHIYKARFNDFKTGNRCHKCSYIRMSKRMTFTYEYVKECIENEGYKLLSKTYKNSKTLMKVMCPEGHIYKTNLAIFRRHKCPKCSDTRLSYEYVKECIENEGYKLLSKTYKNSYTKLNLECPKGHKFKKALSAFQQGHRCPKCICKYSKMEKEMVDIVKKYYDGTIVENDRTIVRNPITKHMLELDVYLPDLEKAIEFNGMYWHNNDYMKLKDQMKIDQCNELSIDLLVIQEKDWITDRMKCQEIIKTYLTYK